MKTKKLFVQNISALLVGLKPPSNASQPASVDKIWKMFTDTIDVNFYSSTGKGTVEGSVAELFWQS